MRYCTICWTSKCRKRPSPPGIQKSQSYRISSWPQKKRTFKTICIFCIQLCPEASRKPTVIQLRKHEVPALSRR